MSHSDFFDAIGKKSKLTLPHRFGSRPGIPRPTEKPMFLKGHIPILKLVAAARTDQVFIL